MSKKVKISWKITRRLLIVILLSVVAISYLSYNQSEELIRDRYTSSLELVSSLKADQIEKIFQNLERNINQAAENPDLVQAVSSLEFYDPTISYAMFDSIGNNLDTFFRAKKETYKYDDVLITNLSEKAIYSFKKQGGLSIGSPLTENYSSVFINLKDSIAYNKTSVIYGNLFKMQNKIYLHIARAIVVGTEQKATLVFRFDISENILPIVSDSTGLGKKGEIILAQPTSAIGFQSITPIEGTNNAELIKHTTNGLAMRGLQNAVLAKEADYIFDTDYSKEKNEVLAYWQHLPTPKWGMVVYVPIEEVYANLDELRDQFFLFGLIILAVSAFASYFILTLITNPITIIKERLKMVAQGILPENVIGDSNDEIGEMASAVKDLVSSLQRTANFSKQIGDGNYDAEFTPMSKQDTLGNALLSMRDSIQEAETKDKARNWIVSGIAEISQILRFRNNLEDLGSDVLEFVIEKIGAVQGAFYTLEENEEEKISKLVMKSSYAYQKRKYLQKEFKLAEGLVGQCAIEKDTILRLEIPDNYMTISSGLLGDKKPKALLFVPLITNDEQVYGVLEFAGFERFTSTEIKFVEEISIIIARTIFNIKVNERTELMLQDSQQLGEELQYQQEILRQNAEEMEMTQEQLKRTNLQLESQITEVNNSQKRLQLLLENASEVITIHEKDGKVRYVSPSVESILGYLQEELTESEVNHVHPDSISTYENMFERVLKNPSKGVTTQYAYYKKNGEAIWVESRATNLLSDPAIGGILVNTRDITERRRAETEQRMRSQMQALSENSPDLIMRVNREAKFFYVNPVIKDWTGRKQEYFLSRTLFDAKLHPSITKTWTETFEEVLETKSKIDLEMDFPSVVGDRIMLLNAIPEFNDDKEVESVLFVVHDITESKQIEREIRTTNRKVRESINYANRIQSAILPSHTQIKQDLKDSFIFYRPRDVVSGDFPWYFKKGDDIYIAAVDCTGHGVPGALISLIGYFLLNDILNTNQTSSVGQILDLLHEGVKRTLRQGNGDKSIQTRDGMDIALCHINLKRMEMEYTGAHRPLLHFSKEKGLAQIKGNKFPIGGVDYKIRTDFTTHYISLKEGDQVFIFSDGLTDQFGGIENKKYGIRKFRELVESQEFESMEDFHALISDVFGRWKGEQKQTDDVLLIGIGF
jgi:PAS domain S-box-containing protein